MSIYSNQSTKISSFKYFYFQLVNLEKVNKIISYANGSGIEYKIRILQTNGQSHLIELKSLTLF